jgi:hypothetical protein
VSPYPDPSWAMWFEPLQLASSSQQRRLLGSLPGLTTALQNHLIRENLNRLLHPTRSHKEDLNRSRNSQEPLHIMVTCCSRATCCDLSLLRLRRASRNPHAGVLLARSKNGTGRVTGPLVSGYKRQHVQLRKESRSAAELGIATGALVVTTLSPQGLLVLFRLSGEKHRRSRAPGGLRSCPGATSAARRSPGNSEAASPPPESMSPRRSLRLESTPRPRPLAPDLWLGPQLPPCWTSSNTPIVDRFETLGRDIAPTGILEGSKSRASSSSRL